MNRYIRLGIVGAVIAGAFAAGSYEGTKYGYDTGHQKGIDQGKAEITDYVVKTCEANNDVLLIFPGKKFYCLTEDQLKDLVQAVAERAIEEFRKQGGRYGQKKIVSGA